MMIRVCAGALAAVCLLARGTALAQSPPVAPPPGPHPAEPSHLVDVEIQDRDRDQAHGDLAHFVVAVSGSGATSSVASTVGEVFYAIKVRRDGAVGLTYAVEVDRRHVRKAGAIVGLQLSSGCSLEVGKRAVVGTVERPDGSRTEVALTLR